MPKLLALTILSLLSHRVCAKATENERSVATPRLDLSGVNNLDVDSILPYPKSPSKTRYLYAVSEEGRPKAELLALDSLAGIIAREKSPSIYRVSTVKWRDPASADSYSRWLVELEYAGVSVNETLLTLSITEIVSVLISAFDMESSIQHYITCNVSDESVSAAITVASASGRMLVAGSKQVVSSLKAAGLQESFDLRNSSIEQVLTTALLENVSKRMYFFQDLGKSNFLGDLAIMSGAAYMQWSDEKSRNIVIKRSSGLSAAFGWGPENDYVSTLNENGIFVHACDFCKNLAALSNADVQNKFGRSFLKAKHGRGAESTDRYTKSSIDDSDRRNLNSQGRSFHRDGGSRTSTTNTANVSHTVAFLMTDGDNLQWILGPWSVDSRWYGSPERGSVPCGWTLSPAIVQLSSATLAVFLKSLTSKDELVSGPSGLGYIYPQTFPSSKMAGFANASKVNMESAHMSLVNMLSQNNDAPACDQVEDLLSENGGIYYPWGDGYAALKGKIFFCGGKPVVSARFSLWGDAKTGEMVGVDGLVANLRAMPNSPTSSSEAYSLIPVHAWSHTYADILEVVERLAKEQEGKARFDIVTPSELLRRVMANVKPKRNPNEDLQAHK